MIASMRKPAISADLQATMKRVMLMENYELGKVGLTLKFLYIKLARLNPSSTSKNRIYCHVGILRFWTSFFGTTSLISNGNLVFPSDFYWQIDIIIKYAKASIK